MNNTPYEVLPILEQLKDAKNEITKYDPSGFTARVTNLVYRSIEEIEQLQTKLAESEARIERLENALDKRDGSTGHCHNLGCHIQTDLECACGHTDAQIALTETPAQSLAAHDAEVVEKAIDEANELADDANDWIAIVRRYPIKLRQQQTNGE